MTKHGITSTTNWNLWGNFIGARDFSPDYVHRDSGTKDPCSDNDEHHFIKQRRGIILGGDISIAKQFLGDTHVVPVYMKNFALTYNAQDASIP